MIYTKYFCIFLLGGLFAEVIGTLWHRWFRHEGLFAGITKEFFRRHHVHHHKHMYPANKFAVDVYEKSCEKDFYFLAGIFLTVIGAINLSGWINTVGAVIFLLGASVYAYVVLHGFHKFYHVRNRVLRKKWYFRKIPLLFEAFKWLKLYHLGHHSENTNFSIGIPFDIVFGKTFRDPTSFLGRRKNKASQKNVRFPRFDNRFTKGCK